MPRSTFIIVHIQRPLAGKPSFHLVGQGGVRPEALA
jgi:hypothetical protein